MGPRAPDDFGKEGIVVERRFDTGVEAGGRWQGESSDGCATDCGVGLSDVGRGDFKW